MLKIRKRNKITKRYITLLEILIAFILVIGVFFPLISPHVFIYKQQKEFINKINLDRLVNLLYGHVIEELSLNHIPWTTIESGTPTPITPELMQRVGFNESIPYKGNYTLKISKFKPDEPPDLFTVYLIKLKFSFTPTYQVQTNIESEKEKKPSSIDFSYDIFIARDLT